MSVATLPTNRRSSPKRTEAAFPPGRGASPTVKQQQVCALCGQLAKLKWHYGALRCSNCGFAVKEKKKIQLAEVKEASGGLELTLKGAAS